MSSTSHPNETEQAQLFQYLPTIADSPAKIERRGSCAPMAHKITKDPLIAIEEKDEAPYIRGWPTEPRPLKRFNFFSVLFSIGELLLALLPLAFIALSIAAAVVHHQPTNGNSVGATIEHATRLVRLAKTLRATSHIIQGPTIFPILFAAVAGRTLKIIARFCAERGAKLGNLELLMASQTVWSTLESQVLLQRVTVVGAYLLILWSLSPLGGQACLRLLERGKHATVGSLKLEYLSTSGVSIRRSYFGESSVFQSGGPAINSIYTASLLAPLKIRVGPQDIWGNVKIPRLETLEPSIKNSTGWMEVPSLTSPDDYTSLVGIPVVGIPQGFATTFALESSYVNLSCSDPFHFSIVDGSDAWSQQLGQLWPSLKPNGTRKPNGTTDPFKGPGGYSTSFFLDISRPSNTSGSRNGSDAAISQPRHMIYASRFSGSDSLNLFNCTLGQTSVESVVNCTKEGTCAVAKMRPSQTASRPWFSPSENPSIVGIMFGQLPYAAGSVHPGDSSPTDIFLNDTLGNAYTMVRSSQPKYVDLGNLAGKLFGTRLALVLNTYWQISLGPYAYTGGLPTNLSMYGSTHGSFGAVESPFEAASSTASTTQEFEVYICNYLWLGLLLLSSCVLLLVSVAGIIIKTRSLAPDMMGFVASMTYDNPYVVLPEGGATLDGMERAKLLRDLRVKIGDVRQTESVGHVAFAAVGSADVGRLEKRRMYK